MNAPADDDRTLDELREALAPLVARNAAFDGWTESALAAAAAEAGVPADRAQLAFPGGAVEMIAAWFAAIDRAMVAAAPPERLETMRVRERIRTLVLARLEAVGPDREALRRALAVLALPGNVAEATRLGWHSADLMWRLAGDRAVDFNHYTKRATLGAVYAATVLAWLDDDSEDGVETRAFLDRRIDDIMSFERLKAKLAPGDDRRFSLARFVGRLRYPAG